MKRILEISTGLIHPPLMARAIIHRYISKSNKVTQVQSIEDVALLKHEPFDAVVIYLHRHKISAGAAQILGDFVSQGGGLLGIHSASASYKSCDSYFELLGGRFSSHGPVQKFSIIQNNSSIFTSESETSICDELYHHTLMNDITVHFSARTTEGADVPIVWTRTHGKGRVFFTAPGHTVSSIKNNLVQKIILGGLSWICRDDSGENKR